MPLQEYFYPRSPCGERQIGERVLVAVDDISIHVPLAGNVWLKLPAQEVNEDISIHVPLAGNVSYYTARRAAPPYFYPRSPCGERPI